MTMTNKIEWDYSPAGRCFSYYLKHKNVTPEELELNCDVPGGYAEDFLAAVRGVHTTNLSQQVGGSHYKDMSIQPWEALEAWLTPEEYRGYHKGVAVSYLARERQKGGTQDIEKAIHHLSRLVEMISERGE
jgi:hypothetical protein